MADDLVVSGIHLDARDTLREIRRLDREMRRLEGQVDEVTDATRRSERGVRSMGRALASAAAAFGAFRAAERTSRFIFRTNVEFQKLEATLKTVTGSAENAEAAFDLILDFAKTTPFQITELVDAFNQLRVRGVDPTRERLRGLGNFAAAFTEDFGRLTNAIVSGSAGVTRSLRRSFGLDIRKDGEELNVVFEDMQRTIPSTADALSELLAEIGNTRFADAMAERMDSLDGKISNLQDVAEIAAKAVGEEGLNEAIQDLVATLEDAIADNEDFAESLGQNLASGVRVADGAIQLLVEHTEAIIRAMQVLTGLTVGRTFATMASRMMQAASAGRGLATVLTVLGGPAGIGFGAAGALAALALEAHGAESDTEELRERVDDLVGSLDDLTDAQIRSKMQDIRAELADTVAQMAELRPDALSPEASPAEAAGGILDRIQRVTGTLGAAMPGPAGGFLGLFAPGVREAIGETQELENRVDVLQGTLAELRAALNRTSEAQGDQGAGGSTREQADAVAELIGELEDELDQLRFSEEELIRRQLVQEGATDAEIAHAMALLDKIDALESEAEAQEEARKAEERRIEQAREQMEEVRQANEQIRQQAAQRGREFASNLELARIQEEIRQAERAAESISQAISDPLIDVVSQTENVVDAFGAMVDGILREMARLTIQQTVGAALTSLLRGALGGGIPDAPGPVSVDAPNLGDTTSGGLVPGFAHGGSFEVPGGGNVDSKMVRFMATPGEQVTVTPKGRRGGGGGGAQEVHNSKTEINLQVADVESFRTLLRRHGGDILRIVRDGARKGAL